MPLFIDDDARLHDSFDIQTAQTLYWKSVPVLVRHPDREDVSEQLTVRILSGVQKQNHSLRVLRVYLSSEADLFFLHTLEVTEEDFQNLKVDQGILVDFANFPGKIISLLEKCIAAQEADSPRFQAVLGIRGAESTFKIVETNDFKQLPHIALSFRPGNDTAVKQFLAFRLLEVKTNCEELTTQLYDTQVDRDNSTASLSGTQQSLLALKEKYDKHMLEMEATLKNQQAAAHEEKLREKSLMKEHFDNEFDELERRRQEQLTSLTERITELDSDSRKLREQKYELDSKVSELSHRLGTSEGANRSLEEEVSRLRAANQKLSKESHETDVKLNETRARLSAMEEKVAAQSEVVQQQRARVKDLEEAVRQWEVRCGEIRAAASSAEQRAKEAAAEVIKGNQIIEKLTTDVKLGKEKVKRKAAIVSRQEEELAQREAAVERLTRAEASASSRCEHLQKEVKAAEDEAGELRAKLDDARQQLQSNEQMIRWLNQQVTDAQLHASSSIPGSRYAAFKPSVTLNNPTLQPPNLLPTPSYTSRYSANPTSTSRPITPAAISPTRHAPTASRFDNAADAVSSFSHDGYGKAGRYTSTSLPRPFSGGGGATPASVYS